MPVKDEMGAIYGRLTVIGPAPVRNGKAAWTCYCACGTVCIATGDALRRRRKQSCGCLVRSGVHARKHGHASYLKGVSRTYKSWQEMRARCTNPKHVSFKYYGAEGISYPTAWERFENFLADMGERPPGATLGRIKNHLGYSKKNCQWESRMTQNNNRRSVLLIAYLGRRQSLARWCVELSLPYPRTYHRFVVQKLPFREVIELRDRRVRS